MFKIYTLPGLADAEDTTVGYLKCVLQRTGKAGKAREWRNYIFEQAGPGKWLAFEKGTPVQIV